VKRILASAVLAVALLLGLALPASAAGGVSSLWVASTNGSTASVAAYLTGSGVPVSWATAGGSPFVVSELLPEEQAGAVLGAAVPPNVIESNTWGMAMSEVWVTGATFGANGAVTVDLRQAGGSAWAGPTPVVKCMGADGVIVAGSWNGGALGGDSRATYTLVGVGNCGSATVYSVSADEIHINWAMAMHTFAVYNPAAGGTSVGDQAWIPERADQGAAVFVFQYRRGECVAPGDTSCQIGAYGNGATVFMLILDVGCADGSWHAGGASTVFGYLMPTDVCDAAGGVAYYGRGAVANEQGSFPGFRYYVGSVQLVTAIECVPAGPLTAGPRRTVTATGSPAPFVACAGSEWAYSVLITEPLSGVVVLAGYYRDWAAHKGQTPPPEVVVPPPIPTAPPSAACVDLACVADTVSTSIYDAVGGVTNAVYSLVVCNADCANFSGLSPALDQWQTQAEPWVQQLSWVGPGLAPLTTNCSCKGFTFNLHTPAIFLGRAGPPGPGLDHTFEILNSCSGWGATLATTSRAGTSLLLVLGTAGACLRFIAAAFSFVGLISMINRENAKD